MHELVGDEVDLTGLQRNKARRKVHRLELESDIGQAAVDFAQDFDVVAGEIVAVVHIGVGGDGASRADGVGLFAGGGGSVGSIARSVGGSRPAAAGGQGKRGGYGKKSGNSAVEFHDREPHFYCAGDFGSLESLHGLHQFFKRLREIFAGERQIQPDEAGTLSAEDMALIGPDAGLVEQKLLQRLVVEFEEIGALGPIDRQSGNVPSDIRSSEPTVFREILPQGVKPWRTVSESRVACRQREQVGARKDGFGDGVLHPAAQFENYGKRLSSKLRRLVIMLKSCSPRTSVRKLSF